MVAFYAPKDACRSTDESAFPTNEYSNIMNEQLKHIIICYHFVRDLARYRHLKVSYISMADM
jgi:hypothetical protein